MSINDLLRHSEITVVKNGQRIKGSIQILIPEKTIEIWLPLSQNVAPLHGKRIRVTQQILERIQTDADGTLSVILPS